MERRQGARGRVRSARKVALMDQLFAELRNAETYLATYEVSRRLPQTSDTDLFLALDRLHREGRIDKIKHPLFRHVFWGVVGEKYGAFLTFAHLTERVERMRAALEAAPPPVGPCDSWAAEYQSWWNGRRNDALQ